MTASSSEPASSAITFTSSNPSFPSTSSHPTNSAPMSSRLEQPDPSHLTCPSEEVIDALLLKQREKFQKFISESSEVLSADWLRQNRKVVQDTFSHLSGGISSECNSISDFVDILSTQPDHEKIYELLSTLDTRLATASREHGSVVSETIQSHQKMVEVCKTEIKQVREDIRNLTILVSRSFRSFQPFNPISESSIDLDDLYQRIASTLTMKDLHEFFSLSSCSRNQVACLPWLLSVPTIFGLFFGLVLAVRCYCCASEKNKRSLSSRINADIHALAQPPANPNAGGPNAGQEESNL